MTMIYLRQPSYPRWCQLASIGGSSHLTVCGARLDAHQPVLISGEPAASAVCEACRGAVDETHDPYGVQAGKES